jgi:hypothetical protein
MSEIKIGDMVKIVKQPKDVLQQIVGEVGFVIDIKTTEKYGVMVSVEAIHKDGSGSGAGAVPYDCVELETSDEWANAKKLREEYMAKMMAESNAFREKWDGAVVELSKQFKIDPASVEKIYKVLNDMLEEYRY